jgi:hypothetical protein
VGLVVEGATAWISQWRDRWHGSAVELGGGADGGCVDFDLIKKD